MPLGAHPLDRGVRPPQRACRPPPRAHRRRHRLMTTRGGQPGDSTNPLIELVEITGVSTSSTAEASAAPTWRLDENPLIELVEITGVSTSSTAEASAAPTWRLDETR